MLDWNSCGRIGVLATAALAGACGGEIADGPPGGGDPSDRPWAHNTGPTDVGALVRTGSMTITTDGAVLEDLDVAGGITVAADNVTIRNFRVTTGASYGIKVESGTTGLLLEDGEITGTSSAGIYALGTVTARRIHIHDNASGDGLKIEGNNSLIEDSFITRLVGGHVDGQQAFGGNGITFRGNNIYMPYPGTPGNPDSTFKSNATFILKDGVRNFLIEGNWLTGGNYTIYCNVSGQIYVRDNVFGRENAGWPDDPGSRLSAGYCAEWSGNTWEDTGDPT